MKTKLIVSNQFYLFGKLFIIGCLLCGSIGLEDYVNPEYFDQFNPPPGEFNTSQIGFDSRGKDNPNALQFTGGAQVNETPMYDNYGNQLVVDGIPVVTEEERVGYYDGFHNGKIHAGAIAKINIDGTEKDCVYLNAVDIQNSGTYSGWVPVDQMSPSSTIWQYSQQINERRESVRYTKNPKGSSRYERMEVVAQSFPANMVNGYIVPDRTSNAGKVDYYYIRDGLLNGFINLPETGNKRHGVQCSRVKPGSSFWRDMDVDNYIQNIYAYNSTTVVGTFRWCYGYFVTDAGTKIYCWTNRECLRPKDDSLNTTIVHIKKRNAPNFAIDGMGGGANGQNVYLWSANENNKNQQWIEIDRGNGYYSYQKVGTNYCIDGNNQGANRQNIYLWSCEENNQNQQWQKIAVGGGAYKLIKRNASGYAFDGGSNGTNGQNVQLYNSSSSSQNLQWIIAPIDDAKSTEITDESTIILYPNPVVNTVTIRGASNSIIRIYDMNGKVISVKHISNEIETMDVSSLIQGLYYIKVNGDNNVSTIKISKK
ncbi:RICIN domain-containing protein [Aquimarina sp. Aq107]|uniref:T9SS type A sorting domain-containing protein n=2 Tax=Aquimarina sp. Aq107 TaxID=1191912 RepID=UPI000D550DA4|nr:RICIN domain-containing protein [Aquimarina sp. Aq107]